MDNVYINDNLYDAFSSATIDTDKWYAREWVRDASSNYLRINKIDNDSYSSAWTLLTEKDAKYIEASVFIDGTSSVSSSAFGTGTISGYFYNDAYGPGSYNAYEGNVFVQNGLQYCDDGSVKAKAIVTRVNSSDERGSLTDIFSHTFPGTFSVDTYYTFSIRFEGKTLTFECNGVTASYSITTDVNIPYKEFRGLSSRLHLDSGESGFMKSRFDDVYIERKAQFPPSVPLLLVE